MGGRSMKDMRGAVLAGGTPPFLGRERAAVNVDVGPERRSPRYHETCLALESIKEGSAAVSKPGQGNPSVYSSFFRPENTKKKKLYRNCHGNSAESRRHEVRRRYAGRCLGGAVDRSCCCRVTGAGSVCVVITMCCSACLRVIAGFVMIM